MDIACLHVKNQHTLALDHFDEGEGDILHDASGNGHDGMIAGDRRITGK